MCIRDSYCIWCRCGLSHDVRVMVPWGGCVLSLKRIFLDESLSRKVLVGGPPCFEDMESCLLGFGNDLLLLIYCLHAFHIIDFSMFWCFMISMLYAMIFRLVIYMFSYLRHPCLNMDLYLCVLTFVLTNVYVLYLCMCIYIMIICMFMSFCFDFYASCFNYMFKW